MIVINKELRTPVYLQVYESIKQQILRNELQHKDKLPSIRHLAIQLDVSVKTIQNAYDQLLMEGYIDSFERSGYFVSALESKFYETKEIKEVTIQEHNYLNIGITSDAFEHTIWRRMLNKILQTVDLTSPSIINGEEQLKKEIVKFLKEYRGTNAHFNQVIIGSSSQALLARLLELVDNPKVAFETPGYKKASGVFKRYANTLAIPASTEGLKTDKLKDANMVYLSPSHQYPFGTIMPVNDRYKMIDWAETNKGYIIEDDYNSVLRYQGNPIPSLQGLDTTGVVIYMGSFSNLMYPSINISYMILPITLLGNHEKSKDAYNQTVSKLDQLTLAKYMEEGHFERHLRKIKKLYSKKSELLQSELSKLNIETVETNAGTHIVVKVKSADHCISKALSYNILLEKINEEYILFRYRGLETDSIKDILPLIFNS